MQKTIVVDLPDDQEDLFDRSATEQLNAARSYGTINSWWWGGGNGQAVPEADPTSILTRVREGIADGLEDLAATLRGDG